jgi:hypothetical protein
MADTPKQTSPHQDSNRLPGGTVPMEDYYMPDLNEDLKDDARGHRKRG